MPEKKEKFKEASIIVENESSFKIEKLEADMERIKSEQALNSFRFETKESEPTLHTEETDECIITVNCQGNCDHITCRMQTMRLQGGRRTSPGSESDHRASHNCPQCG